MFCLKKIEKKTTYKIVFIALYKAGEFRNLVNIYLEYLKKLDCHITLIIQSNKELPTEIQIENISSFAHEVWIRNNEGYDFGAWSEYLTLQNFFIDFEFNRLFLLNDSIIGPFNDAHLDSLINSIHISETDFIGLTINKTPSPHIQSYFIALRPNLYKDIKFQSFIRDIKNLNSIEDVSLQYEIPLTSFVHSLGFTIGYFFESKNNEDPTVFETTKLLNKGFPFIKRKCFNTHRHFVNFNAIYNYLIKNECNQKILTYIRDFIE